MMAEEEGMIVGAEAATVEEVCFAFLKILYNIQMANNIYFLTIFCCLAP